MAMMAATVNVLLAAVLLVQYRVNKRYPGFGWWAAGQAALALALILNNARSASWAGRVAIPVWQICAYTGFALVYVGLLRFLGRRERRGRLVLLAAVLAFWATTFTFVVDRQSIRIVGYDLVLAGLLTAMSVAAWRYRLSSVPRSSAFLAAVFAGTAALHGVGAVVQGFRFEAVDPVFEPSPFLTAGYVIPMAGTILWVFGLVFMVNERLQSEITWDAQEASEVAAETSAALLADTWSDPVTGLASRSRMRSVISAALSMGHPGASGTVVVVAALDANLAQTRGHRAADEAMALMAEQIRVATGIGPQEWDTAGRWGEGSIAILPPVPPGEAASAWTLQLTDALSTLTGRTGQTYTASVALVEATQGSSLDDVEPVLRATVAEALDSGPSGRAHAAIDRTGITDL